MDLNEAGQILVRSRDHRRPSAVLNGSPQLLTTPAEAEWAIPEDMNSSGDVAGFAFFSSVMTSRPLLWRGGAATEVRLDGWALSAIGWEWGPLFLNDAGHVAATVQTLDEEFHAVLIRGPSDAVDLGRGSARALNGSDVVAGVDPEGRVVVFRDGPETVIGERTDLSLGALSINARGDVAGHLRETFSIPVHAFLFHDGVRQDLGRGVVGALNDRREVVINDDPGARLVRDGITRVLPATTKATDITEDGRIVGSVVVGGQRRPFLWVNGELQLLPVGSFADQFVGASHINESGLIVGRAEHYGEEDGSPFGTRTLIWRPHECTNPPPDEPTE